MILGIADRIGGAGGVVGSAYFHRSAGTIGSRIGLTDPKILNFKISMAAKILEFIHMSMATMRGRTT